MFGSWWSGKKNNEETMAELSMPKPWAWIRKLNSILDDNIIELNPFVPVCLDLPVQLSPWLYISDESKALDKGVLQKLGITHVLSMNAVPSYRNRHILDFYESLDIVNLRIHAEDAEGYNLIEKHGEECLNFLRCVQEKEGLKVVVHCVAGINRSGLISCAALMIFEQRNVTDAVKHCRERRGTILSNKSFREELCLFAAKHDLLGEKPEGFSDEPIEKKKIGPLPIRAFDALI